MNTYMRKLCLIDLMPRTSTREVKNINGEMTDDRHCLINKQIYKRSIIDDTIQENHQTTVNSSSTPSPITDENHFLDNRPQTILFLVR